MTRGVKFSTLKIISDMNTVVDLERGGGGGGGVNRPDGGI